VTISGNAPMSFDILGLGFTGGTHAAGGGGGSGKVSVHDISITKVVDAASPTLSLYCANGKHIPKVTVVLRKAGKVYQTIKLSDVLVSSFQIGGHGSGGTLPLDHVTLNFSKIELK
jgi:type VI secretion system secreted protein Hcp